MSGGIPRIIPFWEVGDPRAVLSDLDGLMLIGGEDIDPSVQTNCKAVPGYQYFPLRDQFELLITKSALKLGLPTLGICRGCQVLFVATGGELIQDIPTLIGSNVSHRKSRHEPAKHSITILPGSKVAQSYQSKRIEVTSLHHQGLNFNADINAQWSAAAISDDGLTEAIELIGESWVVGVLWHPELDRSANTPDIISKFVHEAGAFHGRN